MTEENIKLFDSELKVMDVLWKDGDVPAKYVADTLNREVGWKQMNLLIRYMMDLLTSCLRHFLAEKNFLWSRLRT